MITISDINKLRLGLKIIQDGEPCIIINSEFVKPGKGQAFNRVKFRKILSDKIIEKTFKSGEVVELADIQELRLMYLYHDSVYWYFMNSITFDQVCVCFVVVRNHIKWLVEQTYYTIIFWNDDPIVLIPPHFVELKVVSIQESIKGCTISPSMKLAVLNTGVLIKVPLFIRVGEYIKVNTRCFEYVSRVKEC